MEAELCHGSSQELSWSPNGGTAVATVIAQWTFKDAHWWYKGGKASLKLIHNIYNSTDFYGATNGRPLHIHSATTTMRVPSSCLLWVTCEWPTSSCSTVLNMLKTSWRLWRPWRGLNIQCVTIERPWQPFGFLCQRRCTVDFHRVKETFHNFLGAPSLLSSTLSPHLRRPLFYEQQVWPGSCDHVSLYACTGILNWS